MIARFQANGESDLWENGRLVSSTFNTSSSAVGQFIRSPSVKLLGNINYASPDSAGPSPHRARRRSFIFSRGWRRHRPCRTIKFRRSTAISRSNGPAYRMSSVRRIYIGTNRRILKGPRPRRVNAGHIQGVAIGDNHRFVFHTAMIEEYDSNWQLITNNQSIAAGIYPAGTGVHSGDGGVCSGQDLCGIGAGFGRRRRDHCGLRRHKARIAADHFEEHCHSAT